MNNDDDKDEDREHRRPWGHHASDKPDRLGRLLLGRRGFLRPQIIQLLEKQPMNGVDMMNELQEMSHGWYRPSPGSIYPLLEQLEKEGLISKNKDGKFELTSAYVEQSGAGGDLASAVSSMESNASYLEDLQRADAARLSKYRERIEKLAKRLEALGGAHQPGSGSS
jgi:DNA-binding PadR family transcriptional regulator